MEIQVSPKIVKVCKECGIKVVRIRTPGRNKGRFGWCAVVDGNLERSTHTYATEDVAYAAAFAHYTSLVKS